MMYLFHQFSYWSAQLRYKCPILIQKDHVRRVKDGGLLHLRWQPTLQLVGLEAHQKTYGDGAQTHQQAQSHRKTWQQPPLSCRLRGALTRRLTILHRFTGCIHNLCFWVKKSFKLLRSLLQPNRTLRTNWSLQHLQLSVHHTGGFRRS